MATAPKKSKDRSAEQKARQRVIDEYGALDAELAPAKARMKRLDELAKTIRAWHASSEAGLTVIEKGEKFQVVVGPKAETTILAEGKALYEALGHDRFLAVAKVTLGALEDSLTDAQLVALTRKERTGTRSLKAIPA